MTAQLTPSEQERYAGQIEAFGEEAQLRLRRSRAIVVGAGATGAAAAAQLASCGVGHLGVVDGGRIVLADLAGQAIYYTPDVGESKADTVAGKLGLLNPEVQTDSYPVDLDAANAPALVEDQDLVLDCTGDPGVAEALVATSARVLHSHDRDGAALAAEAIEVLAAVPAEARR